MDNRKIIIYEPKKDDNCEFEVKKQAIVYYKKYYNAPISWYESIFFL